MGDDDRDPFDLGQLLFGYLVYREIRDGRLDPDAIIRAGCLVVVVIGALLGGGLLLLGGLSTSPYGGGYVPVETRAPYPTQPAFVLPATPRPTVRPVPTAEPAATPRPSPTPKPTPTPRPSPTPKPTPVLGIGKRVPAPGGWAVTVTKVERWRPAWYDERGWRLLTVYVKVRMPAADYRCAWADAFWLQAKSGRVYQGWLDQVVREPELFACADYHRATTDGGWVTFEIRDADAKGLLLRTCLWDYPECPHPAVIRLS